MSPDTVLVSDVPPVSFASLLRDAAVSGFVICGMCAWL